MKVGVFHTAFIGDLACAGKLIEALFESGHTIWLISNKGGHMLYQNDPRLHRTIAVRKRKGLGKLLSVFQISRSIRELELDALVVPHRSFTSGLIAWLSRVPIRVGFQVAAQKCFLSECVRFESSQHESQRIFELGKNLLPLSVYQKWKGESVNILSHGWAPSFHLNHPYFVVSPGSVWATKRYPIEKLAICVEHFLKKWPDLHCVVSGGPGEETVVESLCSQEVLISEHMKNRVHDTLGLVPLWDLAPLLANAKFSIANDSGPLHVACAVSTPTVGVYGPTSYRSGLGPIGPKARAVSIETQNGAPLSCQPCSLHGHARCPKGHFRCMKELKPETVIEALEALINPESLRRL
jgi:heptosyltransferase II